MTNLRDEARGRTCQVRIPGVCNHNTDTVVLAHLNGAGMGRKHPDWMGAWCCSACHDVIDGRVKSKEWGAESIKLMHYQGVIRTLSHLEREGKISF